MAKAAQTAKGYDNKRGWTRPGVAKRNGRLKRLSARADRHAAKRDPADAAGRAYYMGYS